MNSQEPLNFYCQISESFFRGEKIEIAFFSVRQKETCFCLFHLHINDWLRLVLAGLHIFGGGFAT